MKKILLFLKQTRKTKTNDLKKQSFAVRTLMKNLKTVHSNKLEKNILFFF